MAPRNVADDDALDDQAMFWAALSHAAAADAYVASDPWHAPGPVLSLLGRALELTLKAYAVHMGAGADTLKYQLGGDLDTCLRHALDRRLDVPGGLHDGDQDLVRSLNAYNLRRRTEYPEVTAGALPSAAAVRELLDRLVHGSFAAIWDEDSYQRKAREAGTPGLTIDTRAVYRSVDAPEPREQRGPRNEMAD